MPALAPAQARTGTAGAPPQCRAPLRCRRRHFPSCLPGPA
ncbi:hypothetical protein SCATT_57870 [Streptantibioticus cattleyicolor NRRL 8057 = DSM 46488]|uniref:Uncharacterized protein n=1 Tax=Streptantibioticus cattleyicolor (strain ATCC 35852 / DSM 46488 / JCM 4925 / NBRC 14057 / NRRL 8057) TaxID=1003195 RepID=G8X1D0_STREN|nr:hypothetical protein SCATT_57870 [Streptantibioticus cattleyicolor NRRL 8057 = DSM 46488]